jgi:asparagine synthase (glutamine-hydrolysing)
VSGSIAGIAGGRFRNRIDNFLRRAALPNPDRFYTDDSFASECFEQLLSGQFKEAVNIDDSLEIVRERYRQANADAELNRLLFIDLQMAISDNDLTKVNRAAKATGISVLYPYLDRSLIDLTGRIPAHLKVKGTKKRYLFKKALSDVLPREILKKKKQGFGLPVGVWFRSQPKFRELLNDVLRSQRAKERGYFNVKYLEELLDRHTRGLWDYSSELWLLMMLELWHRQYVDG